MAEHTHSGTAELGAPMDYPEHDRTFTRFVNLTKITVLGSIATLIALALFAFGGGAGFWLGVLMILLVLAAIAVGLVGKGTIRPLVVVTGLGVLFVVLTVS